MLNFIPVFIGLRYTRAKRRHQFISFVSAFSLIGMALGTLSLIVVLSVMNGFDREIKQRILSVVPHIFVEDSSKMKDWESLSTSLQQQPNIIASAPYIGGVVMLSSNARVYGVELQAVLPSAEKNVSVLDNYMLRGELANLSKGEFGIILGGLVARYLNVEVGDTVVMTLPKVSVTPAGVFPRSKRFIVAGIFEVGAQVDQSLAMIHLNDAQKLFRYGNRVQGLRVKVSDIYKAAEVGNNLSKELSDNFTIKDWSQTQGSLFQAIKLEKRMVTLLLMIIIAVAALTNNRFLTAN